MSSNAAEPIAPALLLDTDVFSFLLKGGRRAQPFRPLVAGRYALVSFVTAGELKAGAYAAKWGPARHQDLDSRLRSTVVVPFDMALIDEYGRVFADAKDRGHPLADRVHANDRWIAAAARVLGVQLLTNNMRHFAGLPGLALHPGP
jgi:tRNA(fMet)-specific endonuclease VapC